MKIYISGGGYTQNRKFHLIYCSSINYSASYLKTLTLEAVADYFGISLLEKAGQNSQIPETKINDFMTILKPAKSPLVPLVKMIHQVCALYLFFFFFLTDDVGIDI